MKIRVGAPKDKDFRRLLLIALGVLVLVIGQPWLWNRVFEAASRFRDRQTQELQLANVNQLVERVRRVDPAELALLEQAEIPFPRQGAAPQIVERLEGLAESKGLVLDLQSINEKDPRGRNAALVPLEVAVAVTGAPRGLMSFIDAVEHMQEYNELATWAIRQAPASPEGRVDYSAQLRLIFYLQPAV